MNQKAAPFAIGAALLALVALLFFLYIQNNKPADAGYTISPPALDGGEHDLKRANYLKRQQQNGNPPTN